MTSFILVPGAMHCAEHFHKLTPLLEEGNDNEAIVVELPSTDFVQSDSLQASFEAHIKAVLAALGAATRPNVLLLGHCMAGRTVTAAAEQCSAFRTQLRLVFLAAETLPGPLSINLLPFPAWMTEGLLSFDTDRKLMAIAEGKANRMGEILYPDASDNDRRAAVKLLQPSPMYAPESVDRLVLDRYWCQPKAYVKCTQDMVMLPEHQDIMHSRLGEGALKFDLESGHGPFVSCPERLASILLEIAALPASAFVLRRLHERTWAEQQDAEEEERGGIRIELVTNGARDQCEAVQEAGSSSPLAKTTTTKCEAARDCPAKRPHTTDQNAQAAVAYRISKSRRDSTLAKVLKFPDGIAVGSPVEYWYESYVDDPAQYTNSRLNVPERGHEAPLDVAGISRSLCAKGIVVSAEGSRTAFSWWGVVTKTPGEPWTIAADLGQVWGIDGREWNGSYQIHEHTGENGKPLLVENLAKYTKGSAEYFWEDVPRKATDLLASLKSKTSQAAC